MWKVLDESVENKLMKTARIAYLILITCFMLGCKTSVDISNQPPLGYPVPDAGEDQSVTEGDTVTLSGSATDSDGTIASYLWAQTSGTQVSLTDPGSETATFTAPAVAETLSFRLTATDNQGNSWSDSINIVISLIPNVAPVADAGEDQAVNEGDEVILGGQGSDTDGSIAYYAWQQTAGTSVTLSDETLASPSFTAPAVAETLTFQLTVTDNDGAFHSDTVDVVVALIPNVAPVVNAGTNQIVLEDTLVTLSGSASDDDGSISSYLWTQTAGTTVTLSSATVASPTFTTPANKETLRFVLQATDNEGATDEDVIDVVVGYDYTAASNIASVPYVRGEQIAMNTDADCTSYEPIAHPAWYTNLSDTIHVIEEGPLALIFGENYTNVTQDERDLLTLMQTDATKIANVRSSLAELRRFTVEDHYLELSPAVGDDGKCYRVNIYIAGTGVQTNDTNTNVGGGAVCDNGNGIPFITVPPYNIFGMANEVNTMPKMVAHEFVHTLQCVAGRDNGGLWAWYVESLANFIGNDAENATVALDQFHQNTNWALDTFFLRYGVWPFWMYLNHTYGSEFTGDVVQRTTLMDESVFEYLRRVAPFDCSDGDDTCRSEAFANLYGEFARSTVNYVTYTEAEGVDYEDSATFAWGWELHRNSAYMLKVGENRYRIADWQAPQRFGHNIIELVRDINTSVLMVRFDGWSIPAREAEWRVSIVATVDEQSTPHVEDYTEMFKSGTIVIDLVQWETELGASIERLHLVVAATPKNWLLDDDLSAFDAPQRFRELDRYVYEVEISGAWPLWHEPESAREAVGVTGAAHANGGGFVADTATVSETAYVGPMARVLENAQVLDNARIEGRAIIMDDAVIRGNAIISSNAEISYRAEISDYATVRDNAQMADDTVASDEAKVQGDAAIWRTYSVSQQGMTLGTPLVETTYEATITGTAISDGLRWLNTGSVNQGTPYDEWAVDDAGLLLKYDFEQAHPYRVRDSHVSSDAYYLDLNGDPTSAVPLQHDTGLNSNVLLLNGSGYVDLPRWVLDQLSYQLEMKFKWQQTATKVYLFDATTESNEQLTLQIVPGLDNGFYVKLIHTDRDETSQELNLPHTNLVADAWMDLVLSYDDTSKEMTLSITPTAGGEGVQDTLTVAYGTREFDYDTLKARLGASIAGSSAFSGSINSFSVSR